jgi:hypothetical protein
MASSAPHPHSLTALCASPVLQCIKGRKIYLYCELVGMPASADDAERAVASVVAPDDVERVGAVKPPADGRKLYAVGTALCIHLTSEQMVARGQTPTSAASKL